MENYYLLFNINMEDSIEEIEQRIKEEQKKWNSKMNSPRLEKQAEAQNKLILLDEAKSILLDIDEKEKYDRKLEESSLEYRTHTESQYQSQTSGETYFDTGDPYSEKLNEIIDLNIEGSMSLPTALYEIKHLIKSYPGSAEIRWWAGTFNEEFGNIEEAKQDFLSAIDIDTKYEMAYLSLAYIHIYKEKDYDEGKRRLNQALEISPDSIGALRAFGEMYYDHNLWGESLEYYETLEYYYPEDEEYRIKVNEINQKLNIKTSGNLYLKARNLYQKQYFESEKQVNDYIRTLEMANEYHPRTPYQTEINKAKSKLKISVDFKFLSLLVIPLILGSYLLNGAGVFGILIFSTVTSIILFNGICPKWKIEKRRASPIIESTLISAGLQILGGLNLIMLLSLLVGSARLASILIMVAAVIYYVGYPKWKEKNH